MTRSLLLHGEQYVFFSKLAQINHSGDIVEGDHSEQRILRLMTLRHQKNGRDFSVSFENRSHFFSCRQSAPHGPRPALISWITKSTSAIHSGATK